MENCCESSARAKIAEKVIAPGPSMLTSSDMEMLVLADVPRNGGQVLLQHSGWEFSVALITGESTADAHVLVLTVLSTFCSSHWPSSPSFPFSWTSLFFTVC